MADEGLSDAELVAELGQYGEVIQLPLKNNNRRQILLKKLNHLRAKNSVRSSRHSLNSVSANSNSRSPRSQQPVVGPGDHHSPSASAGRTSTVSSPKANNSRAKPFSNALDSRGRPSSLDDQKSDDSDEDNVTPSSHSSSFLSSISRYGSTDNNNVATSANHVGGKDATRERKRYSQLSDSVLRTLRRRTVEPPLQPQRSTHKSGVLELSTEEKTKYNNSINDGSDDEIPVPSPARSRLYSDLNKMTSFLSKSNDNKFESSDSDLDESTSSRLENKSISFLNSSFNVNHSGAQDKGSFSSVRSSYLNNSNTLPSRSYLLRRDYQNGHHRVQQYRSRYLEVLPQILVAVAVLFFIALFVTYVVIHKDFFFSWFSTSSNMGAGDHLLLCNDVQTVDCFSKEEVDRALKIIEKLFEELSLMKGKTQCDTSRFIDDAKSVDIFKNQIIKESEANTTNRVFECCLRHILVNPHWHIRAETTDGSLATDWQRVAKLRSEIASMSFTCRLWRSFSTVLYGIFVVALVIVVVLLLSLYIKYRLKQREAEQKEVYAMVEKIIDILQNQYEQTKASDSGEPHHLAVQHVRDQLLHPSIRHKLQPIWDKAVKFIAANESRIRLETRLIHGDEFEVWHWLQPALHNGKIWQGQAFGENRENKGSNQVIYSPTPCLKIRNMFDSNVENEDNWEDSVTDAILEKCKNIDSIVHIFVDVDSREGCVYLKCSSCEAAGRARLSLHGWWFDGRLVTVKHLKTDHYHKRWPEAREATKPLKPSTDQMRSLSQPYYRSSLEMT